jgi:AraC-like DNA-binding protein
VWLRFLATQNGDDVMQYAEDRHPVRDRDTVAAYFVSAGLWRLRNDPVRAKEILRSVNIDPDWLNDALFRIPAQSVIRFWLSLTEEFDDEFFAFDSHGMPRGTFAIICRHVIHEPDLGRALSQCLQAFGLFIHDIQAHLEIRGRRAAIVVENHLRDSSVRHVAEEIFLSMVIGVICWLTGRRLLLDSTEFGHARPAHGADPLLWGPWIKFDAPKTRLEFDAEQLKLPVIRDFRALKHFLRAAPEGVVVRFRNRSGLTARVYRELRDDTGLEWPTQAQMAKDMNMTHSAFRRRLEREGLSFQAIKHQVRRAIAIDLLSQGDTSITEIAIRARFQEPSAFHRAFRQWTGMSPGQYRESSRGHKQVHEKSAKTTSDNARRDEEGL